MLANKAAVVFECTIGETSFASIVCHLSPHDQNWEQRNSQWHELVGNMNNNLDYFVFMGDLNYRIGVSYEKCLDLIKERCLADLFAHDQLQATRQSDPIIGRFCEAPIHFNPTFKFDKNSDAYDTSAKHRVPAWTDRVLVRTAAARMRIGTEDSLSIETDISRHYMAASIFTTDPFSPMLKLAKPNFPRPPHCICYRIILNTFSDHRPVQAIYKFPIAALARESLKDLNDVIAAKFEEIRAYSTPALKVVSSDLEFASGQIGSFVLQNASGVWAHWRIAGAPSGIEFPVAEGLLMAAERVTVSVKYPIKMPMEDRITVEVAGGNPVPLLLGAKFETVPEPEPEREQVRDAAPEPELVPFPPASDEEE
jgi:hypothetical protein